MARPVYRYQPRNESPDIAIGIKIPFNDSSNAKPVTSNYASGSLPGRGVFAQSYTTEEQVISNLKNLLLTRKGERIMQPNFGTDIYDTLFQNNVEDLRLTLKDSLIQDIEYWLPYINVNDVVISSSTDMHTVSIVLKFTITNIGSELGINILASENDFTVTDAVLAEPTLELRQISNGY